MQITACLSRLSFDSIAALLTTARKAQMITAITLQQHADIYEAMTDRKTHHSGGETFYSGHHPDYDNCIIFQNDDSGTLIEIGKFLPGDVD
jgi:hypothetical protein